MPWGGRPAERREAPCIGRLPLRIVGLSTTRGCPETTAHGAWRAIPGRAPVRDSRFRRGRLGGVPRANSGWPRPFFPVLLRIRRGAWEGAPGIPFVRVPRGLSSPPPRPGGAGSGPGLGRFVRNSFRRAPGPAFRTLRLRALGFPLRRCHSAFSVPLASGQARRRSVPALVGMGLAASLSAQGRARLPPRRLASFGAAPRAEPRGCEFASVQRYFPLRSGADATRTLFRRDCLTA